MESVVRRANLLDAREIQKMLGQTKIAEQLGGLVPESEITKRCVDGLVSVVEVDGKIVSSVIAKQTDTHSIELRYVGTDPEFRRAGFARSQIRFWTSQPEYTLVSVSVVRGNEPMEELLKSEGFEDRVVLRNSTKRHRTLVFWVKQ